MEDKSFLHVGLETLMPNSLSSLAGSLKHLVLSNNDLHDVPTMAFRQLRELDHVNLNQNNISIIKDGAFWGLSKVTRLTLYNNKISHIHPDAFDGLTKFSLLIFNLVLIYPALCYTMSFSVFSVLRPKSFLFCLFCNSFSSIWMQGRQVRQIS